jgi:hypothetical protein
MPTPTEIYFILYEIHSLGVRDLGDVAYCRKHTGRHSEKADLP